MYLTKLFKHSKIGFILVLLLIVGQTFFTYKGIETFPFLHWGMYSKIEGEKSSFEGYRIEVNGEQILFTSFSDVDQQLLVSPLSYYCSIKDNGGIDPLHPVMEDKFRERNFFVSNQSISKALINEESDLEAFPSWFHQRLNQNLEMEPDTTAIYRCIYTYSSTAKPRLREVEYLF